MDYGQGVPHEFSQPRPGEPPAFYADPRLASVALNWKPRFELGGYPSDRLELGMRGIATIDHVRGLNPFGRIRYLQGCQFRIHCAELH